MIRNLTSAVNFSDVNSVRFDSDSDVTYHIVVDRFSGTPGRFELELSHVAAPPNDRFAERIVLEPKSQIVQWHNIGARLEPGEPRHAGYAGGRSVWWEWSAPTNGLLTLALSGDVTSLLGQPFYKVLAVYRGNQLASLQRLKAMGGYIIHNRLELDVLAGETYVIAADGQNGEFGHLTLDLAFRPAPSNDHFADAISFTAGQTAVQGFNTGGTKEVGEPGHAGNAGGHSVWWTWTAPLDGVVSFTTEGSSFDTLLSVYTGPAVANLVEVASNDDSEGSISTVLVNTRADTAYHIAVDGFSGAAGEITLVMRPVQPVRMETPTILADGSALLTFHGEKGTRYSMFASTNLVDWTWLEDVQGQGGVIQCMDQDAPQYRARFYKIITHH